MKKGINYEKGFQFHVGRQLGKVMVLKIKLQYVAYHIYKMYEIEKNLAPLPSSAHPVLTSQSEPRGGF